MSMYRVFSCVVGRGCLPWSVYSFGKTLLAFDLFCTPRLNLPVTLGISWLPTFAFQSPMMKGHLFWVFILESLVGLHRTVQFQSEFGNKEFMVWATVSSWCCFCWLYRASPSLAAKNIINLISVLTIWLCPCIESSLVLLEEGVC